MTYLGPGSVFGSDGRLAWGQSSRGWSHGRCTVGIRLLSAFRGFLRVGLFGGSLAGADYEELIRPVPDGSEVFWDLVEYPRNDRLSVRCRQHRWVFEAPNPPCWAVGSRLWLQLDVDTGEVRLRVDDTDFGVVAAVPVPLARPVFPAFILSALGACDAVFELL